jgi:general secretion pathway protein N
MRFLRRFFLVVFVLLAIAVVVVATCPAEYAYRLLADRMGVVRLSGVTGTLWQGHATNSQVFGQELGALDWTLQAAPLLNGELIAHVQLAGGQITASGVVDRTWDGTINLRDAVFRLPASMAAPALDIPALQLLGNIDGKLSQGRLRGLWIDQASGSLRWGDAAVAGAAQAVLGDLEATFASAPDGTIAGVVHDLEGPMRLNGTFKISAGSFDAEANLDARDGNQQVIEALRYIGEPQADGSSHLVIHGQLFKLF